MEIPDKDMRRMWKEHCERQSMLMKTVRIDYQVPGEARLPGENFHIIACPRCHKAGSTTSDHDKLMNWCSLCGGEGLIRKLTFAEGWYVTKTGEEVYY